MNDVLKRIGELPIIPVVAIDDAADAAALGDALAAGGLPIAEITFRTDAAEQSIRTLARRADLAAAHRADREVHRAARQAEAHCSAHTATARSIRAWLARI